MMHPQLQLSQPGLIQGGAAGMTNPDVFRRIMQAQLSAKDGSQVSIYSVYTYDSTGPSAVFLTSSYEHTGVHQNLRRYTDAKLLDICGADAAPRIEWGIQ